MALILNIFIVKKKLSKDKIYSFFTQVLLKFLNTNVVIYEYF